MDFFEIWLFLVLFSFGACIGSFINALEYRLFRKLDFVKTRSFCPKCKHVLGPGDLVPILSFIVIKGKCRYCETKVSRQYPTVELISGLLFVSSGVYINSLMHIYGISDILQVLFFSILLGLLFSIFLFFALYDVKHKIVSNRIVIPAIIIALIINVVFAVVVHYNPNSIILTICPDFNFLWNILSGILGGFMIAIIIILTKGKGMGGGDLKLVVFMGLVLGPKKLIIAMYIAVITGALAGIIWGIFKGKIKGLKLPFGLFLSIGAVLSILLGNFIWEWYGDLLLA